MVFETGTGADMIGPEREIEFDPIYRRAHTFDGYRHLGGDMDRANEHMQAVRASWVSDRAVNWALDDLRAALFIEARSVHGSGYPPSERLFIYLRDLDSMITAQIRVPLDRTDEYRSRDLFAEHAWPKVRTTLRFGAVVFDDTGQVLLREPRDNFDGYAWTFSKGKAKPGEHPVDAALRATVNENGIHGGVDIIGHVPGMFSGTATGSANYYYVARAVSSVPDPSGLTTNVRWFPPTQAETMIEGTTNVAGRARDLATLRSALIEYRAICGKVEPG